MRKTGIPACTWTQRTRFLLFAATFLLHYNVFFFNFHTYNGAA